MKNVVKFTVSLLALGFAPALAVAGTCNQTPTCTENQEANVTATEACTLKGPCDLGVAVERNINQQTQFGDVESYSTIAAGESLNGTEGSATAVGNLMSGSANAVDFYVQHDQATKGNVIADSLIVVDDAHGDTLSTVTAQGNSGQVVGLNNATYTYMQQETLYGKNIYGVNTVSVDRADNIDAVTQVAGNNFNTAVANGYLQNRSGQYNASETVASTYVEGNEVFGYVNAQSIAAGNSHVTAGQGAEINSEIEQKTYAPVIAETEVNVGITSNAAAVATAYGNNTSISNEWGQVSLSGVQETNGDVSANSEIYLNDWSETAFADASATGNGVLISNIGQDANLVMAQNNYGNVSSTANFSGSSSMGGVGGANSFAVGNTITGFVCAGCNGGNVRMNSNTSQTNYGNVYASSNVTGGSSGALVGSAMAVGNNATFIAKGSN
jgi:hypothetical protein